jgi:hypothetical protein
MMSPTNSFPPGNAADLALLRTSKATREEAMTVLYAECQFRYLIDLAVGIQSPLPRLLPAVKLMNKIKLEFRSGVEEDIAQICVAVVEMLAETNRTCCERLRIVLRLKDWDAASWSAELIFGTSKTMECNRTVTIELDGFRTFWRVCFAIQGLDTNHEAYWLGVPIEGKL